MGVYEGPEFQKKNGDQMKDNRSPWSIRGRTIYNENNEPIIQMLDSRYNTQIINSPYIWAAWNGLFNCAVFMANGEPEVEIKDYEKFLGMIRAGQEAMEVYNGAPLEISDKALQYLNGPTFYQLFIGIFDICNRMIEEIKNGEEINNEEYEAELDQITMSFMKVRA